MTTPTSPFEPFTLHEHKGSHSLLFIDRDMVAKMPIFEERAEEGWNGSGYDWTSIAQVVLAEKLPDIDERISFDSEAGMFCALGRQDDLESLAREMVKAFNDDAILRDLLSRAELD